jgi:hypothetical protein
MAELDVQQGAGRTPAERGGFRGIGGRLRRALRGAPVPGRWLKRAWWRLGVLARPFPGSRAYWERRYAAGGDSGVGSYGRFAEFKAEVINAFVTEHAVQSVIELGCGDGHQLSLANYPRYLGFDVSETALRRCRERFAGDPTRSFEPMEHYRGQRAELALSLDVLYHLVEDPVFEDYLRTLFGAAERYVIIYSSDTDERPPDGAAHVRHRRFSRWIEQHLRDWTLCQRIRNRHPYTGDYRTGSFAEFFIYQRV